MIAAFSLDNLTLWALQATLVASVGAILPLVLRIRHPRSLLAYHHAVLLLCFALPVIQPWQDSLEVVAPGFEKTDFKVNVDGNVLTISAEKTRDENRQTEKQIRKEYSYRSFKRSFTIDDKIDATAIDASYVNGVLKLNLPKKAEVGEAAKDITIK